VWRDGAGVRQAVVRQPSIEVARASMDARAKLLPAERLTALIAACVEIGGEGGIEVARELTVGDRATLALHLRQALFGDRLTCRLPCIECGDDLALDVSCSELIDAPGGAAAPRVGVEAAGRAFSVRLPTGEDEEVVARLAMTDADLAARTLLERLLVGDGIDAVNDSPDADGVIAEIEAAVAAADPMAEIQLGFACPSCGTAGSCVLEPLSFVLAEIDASVHDVERDVDILARAYGWSERDILALPTARRKRYVELVGPA
jgi:hypothetical protein